MLIFTAVTLPGDVLSVDLPSPLLLSFIDATSNAGGWARAGNAASRSVSKIRAIVQYAMFQ
jgi:hypothetical protein